jgi:hypothetical protein
MSIIIIIYCDERGIFKFYFITIAENIHLQFNKFRFVLTTSNCFCSIYEFHLFPFTHMFCKYQDVRKTEPFLRKVFWNLTPFQIAKLISLVSFKRPSGISLRYQGGETPTTLDQSTRQGIHLHTKNK